jgi:FtsP/CotA-like multicopper oxidase with cupredoxin domain
VALAEVPWMYRRVRLGAGKDAEGRRTQCSSTWTGPGMWVWHCHILDHVEREAGMYGMVTSVVVS